MTHSKSYTSLEQSRRLAEILPLESADMYYSATIDAATFKPVYGTPPRVKQECSATYKTDVPAWSLSALLDVIPEIINFEDDESDYALEILKEGDLYYLSYGNPLEGDKLNIEPQENFVDACVAMIEKLNELNLL